MNDLRISFVKASACGNSFLLVKAKTVPDGTLRKTITIEMCDAHNGIGADGVEWISPGRGANEDVIAELINSDGSEAEVSGNGTRCVAAHWVKNHGGERVRVRTDAGVKECVLTSRKDNDFEFEMNMGAPKIDGPREFSLARGKVAGTKLSMGNPQFVVFVNDFDLPWQKLGAEIQAQKEFPQGTNVAFVRIVSVDKVEARFFERGAGETQSSGTGSCAAAVAAISAGNAKSPLTVHAVGGAQTVRWENDVYLRGSVRLICKGEYYCDRS